MTAAFELREALRPVAALGVGEQLDAIVQGLLERGLDALVVDITALDVAVIRLHVATGARPLRVARCAAAILGRPFHIRFPDARAGSAACRQKLIERETLWSVHGAELIRRASPSAQSRALAPPHT